jgi:hypothetical protein
MKTALEAVLQAMITQGWANESDGDVEAPTGHFARVTNEARDIDGVHDAFKDVIVAYGLGDESVLIGHFLVREDSQGFVDVTSYDNPIELTRDFQALQDAYAEWNKD